MNKPKKNLFFFSVMLVLFSILIAQFDRSVFKANHSFSLRFLYTCLPNNPNWNLPPPSQTELSSLDPILNQKFYYLAKGAHCFAFISEDKNYVIKFHKYASHMRIFPWLNHPFGYRFNEKRKAIKAYNLEKLAYNLSNYKASFEDLKEENGLILVHINRTDYLKKTITLVDNTKAEYQVPLDQVTFILQQKANLIYPTLDHLYSTDQFDQAKQVVSNIIELILTCSEKGYIDQDPVLRKNYGLLEDRAIHIDIGDLVKSESMNQRQKRIEYVKELTECLKKRIEKNYPLLLDHYNENMRALEKRAA